MPDLSSAKTVIRCQDFAKSRLFYSAVLGLTVIEEWDEPNGKGAIFGVNRDRTGFIEIYEMSPASASYDPAFSEPLRNDKIDLQLRTDSLKEWVKSLDGLYPYDGPEDLPWGQRWIRLRDPNGLQIAIYEGQI